MFSIRMLHDENIHWMFFNFIKYQKRLLFRIIGNSKFDNFFCRFGAEWVQLLSYEWYKLNLVVGTTNKVKDVWNMIFDLLSPFRFWQLLFKYELNKRMFLFFLLFGNIILNLFQSLIMWKVFLTRFKELLKHRMFPQLAEIHFDAFPFDFNFLL